MTQKDVAPVLQQHKEWINNRQGKKADLRGADLRKINLEGCDLRFADFRAADLAGANLSRANCQHADFRGANLTDAVCIGTNFTNARLDGANMNGVDLRTATMEFAQLPGANLASSYQQTPTEAVTRASTNARANGHIAHGSLQDALFSQATPQPQPERPNERHRKR
jgi:hypothetical protein